MNELVKVNGVDVDVNVSKDDILAIAVSEYEQRLIAEQRELETQYRDLESTFRDKKKELANAVTAFGASTVESDCLTLIMTLKNTGFGTFVHTAESSLTEDGVQVNISIKNSERSFGSNLSSRIQLAPSSKIQTLKAEHDKIEDQLRENAVARMEIRRDLANIATQERLAKANLARKVLNSSVDGRKLLAQLSDGKNGPNVLSLTGPQD